MRVGDFHIHSNNSDGLNDIKDLIKIAYRRGLNCIAITDHNILTKLDKYEKFARAYGIKLISGSEVKTNCGDILLLFIDEVPKSRDAFKIIDNVKENGGIVVLPHPYRDHKNIEKISKLVDFIEINYMDNILNQIKAIKLALKLKKPLLANSDAHSIREVGAFRNIIKEEDVYEGLLKKKVKPVFHKNFLNICKIRSILKRKIMKFI